MKNLKTKVLKGVKFSILEKGALFLLGIIQLGIVVRYIDKGEIGLMALVNTILAITTQFSELGIGNSIIHQQNTDRDQLSSIYWSQVIMGLFMYLLLALSAGTIAGFYENPALEWMIYLLGSTVFIYSFGQNYSALLYRDLHFGFLTILRVTVTGLSFFTVCILALNDYGLWSLIIGALVKCYAQVLLLILYGRSFFWPKLRLKVSEIAPHANFGIFQTGERLVNLINNQLDTLIIGKLLGEEILGVYDVIKKLLGKIFRMVNTSITTVMLPVFAKLQFDSPKISSLYLRQIRYLSSINFPLYLFIAFNTLPLLTYLLNPEWFTPTNQQLVIYFCLYFILHSVQNPLGTVLISHGRVRESFWYNLAISLFVLPLVLWGAQSSILMVIQLLVIFQLLRVFASFHFLLKPLVNFRLGAFFTTLFSPFWISAVSILISHYLTRISIGPWWIVLALEAGLFSLIYLSLSAYYNRIFFKESKNFLLSIFTK